MEELTYDEIVAKLRSGEKLNEHELRYLTYNGIKVDEIEGDEGRWSKGVSSIIQIGDDLWCIEWERGLTECQEDEFYTQPYRVNRVEKVVTQTVVTYERVRTGED